MKWITRLLLLGLSHKFGYRAARRWHRFYKTLWNSPDDIIRHKQAKTQKTTTAAHRTPPGGD